MVFLVKWVDYTDYRKGKTHTVVGTVKVLAGLESYELDNVRDILVYLPPSYAKSDRSYPVLYMQDGQNLFDRETAFAGEWELDEAMERLAADEGLEAIIVGIPNAGESRLTEYSPFTDRRFGGGKADAYLRFLLGTVKPLVDRKFRTLREREATGIGGSSMGGLLALYAFFEYPESFGMVASVSPSVGFAGAAMMHYLVDAPFVPGKIYVDVGTAEGSPRARDPLALRGQEHAYLMSVRQVVETLSHKGYVRDADLRYVEDTGAVHNEQAWANRFPEALRFLLGAQTAVEV